MPTYTLDGVPLDHPAGCWTLKKGTRRRPLPGVRAVEVSVPGRAGELPVLGLDHATTTIPLVLGVTGRSPAGAHGGFEQLEANLEALAALLGVRHRLMTLTYTAGSITRAAEVTITAVSDPEVDVGAVRARLTAFARVPGVYWRDPAEATWAGSANASAQPVTTLAGSTAPITDALVRVTGPAVNPRITDVATGGAVTRPGGLLTGERLLLDCATMRAALVDTDTWDLAAGDDVTGQIDATGPGSAFRWIHFTPAVALADPHSRAVLVTSSATSTTADSRLEIRARRAYL
ncbi:hypothetical protein Ppa06_58300 [Planomonospora parontospora subsp. parontospora]|uniref:Uncharacterized protein n=2 Tax=Planomonospora parontospora TaxID=58119 RepID=A0AA37BM38_9ACTN|nr:hypothetical protein [Planomonospora parontospora]GGK90162.1 hypothetical protein GCM10010126_57010 [Planomonospora parontospora]GII12032.1 hypothetical protein Ppa06_58300 [Planomonospora parontospora subsp. parontospora]